MKKSIHLSIASPCQEKWQTFTPVEQGGFCQSCSKTVIDFTTLTDTEILHFIKHKPAHVCGRFNARQLKTYELAPPPHITRGWSLLKTGLAGVLLFSVYEPVTAQVTPTVQAEAVTPNTQLPGTASKPQMTVKGNVTASEDGSALPGVNVVIKGTARGTVTDFDGNFELADVTEKDVLVFSFIGLKAEEYAVAKHAGTMNIQMKMELEMEWMGELSIQEEYQHPSALQRFWRSLKSIF